MSAEEKVHRQGLRITTWNVNGIRNPFAYQPWRQDRTFAAMFEILEADIVVMQETKIQRKDLKDDMVLVPGWDVFFSLPKHKKGYSGVVIYTRNSVCAPIRAEEGITGALTPPNSSTSFFDLPKDQQIGGYPTPFQLSQCGLDATTLDSEGRCVILEFPAFVLIGTYCPATRDESRDEFRIGFLDALDARVRNLVSLGKRVFLTGDLNIMREEIDTANIEEGLKKRGLTVEEYFSSSSRKMLNQLLVGGKVYGEREEGREKPVMWDICRAFHPTRKGMYTCWEQKINARPGNFGSRIDYVLCSEDWKDWFFESNIQEGLMGSDHCPVYAVLKDKVKVDNDEVNIRDLMSNGLFKSGVRQRDWTTKDLLPLSAKLIPEFDKRRNIKDMFTKKPSALPEANSTGATTPQEGTIKNPHDSGLHSLVGEDLGNGEEPMNDLRSDTSEDAKPDSQSSMAFVIPSNSSSSAATLLTKRPAETKFSTSQKRSKTATKTTKGQPPKGQSSLKGFFKPKMSKPLDSQVENEDTTFEEESSISSNQGSLSPQKSDNAEASNSVILPEMPTDEKPFVDPIVAKESWSKLLTKRVVPRCEHNEPCISLVTKKVGVNFGRSFYMCPRPLGPSGQKERNTQWRCGTFIWSSDWTRDAT